MAFEKTVKYRTPDGVEHESAEAAKLHMRGAIFGALGEATSGEFELAVKGPSPAVDYLRDVIREIYLLTWPRANAGKPRGPRKAKETALTSPPNVTTGDDGAHIAATITPIRKES